MASGRLTVDGGSLAWESSGEGPPIVLVHGFALTRDMWDDVVPGLAAHHQVVRYDCRGFGDSAAFDASVSYSHGDDLIALCDGLGITRTALVGLSFGGQVALLTAIAAPERVSALILVDAVLDEVPWDPASQAGSEAVIARTRTEGPQGGRAAWLDHPLFGPANERPVLAQRLAAMVATYPGHHWMGADCARPVNPHAVDMLDRVTVPTTVVIGERDVPCFITMSDILARDVKDARLVRIPGAGHMTPMEAPEALVDAIESGIAMGSKAPG
ncbi:MAG: alpha/beta hydrolase [Candidatus Dormibacteraeota bacterium]|uniref:Alpha/beta hydrolase n=1 Tax=Candidatus Aeolococcus gillhamiae TaxID=3127015 RepID=A0A934MZJ1_9BACT|nr:alpha/beta hydrolase [Candidatus Dormibacteraeota bacterium]